MVVKLQSNIPIGVWSLPFPSRLDTYPKGWKPNGGKTCHPVITRTVEGVGVRVLHQRILCWSWSRSCRVENLWSSFGHARCGVKGKGVCCLCFQFAVFFCEIFGVFFRCFFCDPDNLWLGSKPIYIYNRNIRGWQQQKDGVGKRQPKDVYRRKEHSLLRDVSQLFRSKWHDISTPPKTVGYGLLENGRDENLFGTNDF